MTGLFWKKSPHYLLASVPCDSSPNASDAGATRGSKKTDKMALYYGEDDKMSL